MTTTAHGTFDVTMRPGAVELDGAINRFEMSKTFRGDLEGTGFGLMLSAGDPQTGAAGYVAIETVEGHLGGRQGSFALQQLGSASGGSQTLRYEVVPGSGRDGLVGLTGALRLTTDADGAHHYELEYRL